VKCGDDQDRREMYIRKCLDRDPSPNRRSKVPATWPRRRRADGASPSPPLNNTTPPRQHQGPHFRSTLPLSIPVEWLPAHREALFCLNRQAILPSNAQMLADCSRTRKSICQIPRAFAIPQSVLRDISFRDRQIIQSFESGRGH